MGKSINLHAGHNKDGMIGCGAIGLIKESTEAREVRKLIANYLKNKGITVYNCTCNNGKNQSDVLSKICKMCNAHTVDLDVSIHFNSGRGDKAGDGKIGGTEVLVTQNTGIKKVAAAAICNKMAKIGFTNRGVKIRNNLYYLNHTKAPAILVEVCFVDDKDDVVLYKKDKEKVANAIAEGILKALQ